MLLEYVKDAEGNKIGVVVAEKNGDNEINFGWSLCMTQPCLKNKWKPDKFDKDLGNRIAIGRMRNRPLSLDTTNATLLNTFDMPIHLNSYRDLPFKIREPMAKMIMRAIKYYKPYGSVLCVKEKIS